MQTLFYKICSKTQINKMDKMLAHFEKMLTHFEKMLAHFKKLSTYHLFILNIHTLMKVF